MRIPKVKISNPHFILKHILKALKNFSNNQTLQKKTGATHASAIFQQRRFKVIREGCW